MPSQPALQRIKLLHLITRLTGGSGGNTLLSALGMDPGRYETWIAAMPGGPLLERAEEAGLACVRIPHMRETISPRDDLLALRQLVGLMRRERFTIVHTHSAKAGVLGRIAAKLAGVPVVVHTFHSFGFQSSASAQRQQALLLLDRLCRPLADAYVGVAPQIAREAVQRRLAPAGRISVVPSAVELSEIPEEPDASVRSELGLAPGAQVVGTVGRLVAQKAPLDFVRMAAIVNAARPGTRFVMVGDASLESAPLERQTRSEARRLGVDVLFTGFRSDAPRIASTFDVFVITSLYEGLGRGLTEAMAAGRPIAATAVNGIPDIVWPGATGLLAPPSDPAAMARCVIWLLDHPEEARRMGAQARQRVLSLFRPAHMCSMLEQIYARQLGIPGPTSELGVWERDRLPNGSQRLEPRGV
jgi:glycosyltransferase involved in cell wall biosynthesis